MKFSIGCRRKRPKKAHARKCEAHEKVDHHLKRDVYRRAREYKFSPHQIHHGNEQALVQCTLSLLSRLSLSMPSDQNETGGVPVAMAAGASSLLSILYLRHTSLIDRRTDSVFAKWH